MRISKRIVRKYLCGRFFCLFVLKALFDIYDDADDRGDDRHGLVHDAPDGADEDVVDEHEGGCEENGLADVLGGPK